MYFMKPFVLAKQGTDYKSAPAGDYIHNNPVEEGIVFRAEDYLYSSAANYAGEKGLLDVIVIK